ncbi:Global transcription regulator sge1 [Hypsizygus marmoreus]|uniref:Global transcription regulator sge1 n=1 Tax=Hypsizygus marmoreus TaxID=39966 RepID=A0A369JRK4_HYPMA|nr:Global transcription regulator sge1 [Hypsizygus marmoreus]
MSAAQPNAQPASAWTEPPWSGWIETTGDALLILEAARQGLIPRVTRRLVDSERKMITSGSVFVFDEEESGIKRWTDGFFWSPSRILGNFLLYRETDKRGAGHRGGRSDTSSDINEQSQYGLDGVKVEGQSLSRPKSDDSHLGVDKQRERTLMGSLTNSYKFKPDGLMKKTFSLTIGGVSQHLISYYRIEDVTNGRLRSPSSLPELASLDISPEYLDKTHFRNPPKVEIGVDGLPRYRGEADDIDTSPPLLTAPLSTGLPLLTDGRIAESSNAARRGKRFDPYPPSVVTKRPRRPTKSGSDESLTTTEQALGPVNPAATYPDPTATTAAVAIPPPAHYPPYSMPNYYQLPGYAIPPPPPPHIFYPPGVTSQQHPQPHPQAPTQYGYSYVPAPSAESQQSTQDPQQMYYSYPPPLSQPQPGPYPAHYAGAWPAPPYAHYPSHTPPQLPQSSVAIEGDVQPSGGNPNIEPDGSGART